VKHLALAFLLAIFCSQSATAGPRNWTKHHKRFLLMEGAAITGAAIHYKGLNHCRKLNGPEPCDAHYGAAYGTFWFGTALTVVAFPAVAEGCWANQVGHFCDAIAYVPSGIQLGWGVHEWRISSYKKDTR
jgi:hypothetical protein